MRSAPEFIMPSKKAARLCRERGEAIDRKCSQMVLDRLARKEDTSSFLAGLVAREGEDKATLSSFERDSLVGTLVGAAVDVGSVFSQRISANASL